MPAETPTLLRSLSDAPNGYCARVLSRGSADLEAVIDRTILQDSSIAVRAEVLSTPENSIRTIEELLAEGYNVCTPSGNYRLTVKESLPGPGTASTPTATRLTPSRASSWWRRPAVRPGWSASSR